MSNHSRGNGMVNYLLAGGGTAGHVNPLLAVADRIRDESPDARILVVGTAEGLESRLVPERGYELLTIPRVPFPRRMNRTMVDFGAKFRRAIGLSYDIIERESIDVVVGFGGYVSTPVYLAARRAKRAIAIHEANAKPGLANRLGARFTPYVGVAFAGTQLPHAKVVGMPLRAEIELLAQQPELRAERRREAIEFFGFAEDQPVALVTGGSLGARRINQTVRDAASELRAAGWQLLHLTGGSPEIDDPGLEGYRQLRYCDRMDLALAVSDLAISRAGSSTVSELTALAIPAIYVPYPVGNGEQRFNITGVVSAGGALQVADAQLDTDWIRGQLLPVLARTDAGRQRLEQMRSATARLAVVDGTAQMVSLISAALA